MFYWRFFGPPTFARRKMFSPRRDDALVEQRSDRVRAPTLLITVREGAIVQLHQLVVQLRSGPEEHSAPVANGASQRLSNVSSPPSLLFDNVDTKAVTGRPSGTDGKA